MTASSYGFKGAIAGTEGLSSVGVLKLGLYSVPGASAGTRICRFFRFIDLRELTEPLTKLSSCSMLKRRSASASKVALVISDSRVRPTTPGLFYTVVVLRWLFCT